MAGARTCEEEATTVVASLWRVRHENYVRRYIIKYGDKAYIEYFMQVNSYKYGDDASLWGFISIISDLLDDKNTNWEWRLNEFRPISLLETFYSERMSQILVAHRKLQKPISLHAGRKKRLRVFQKLQTITDGELQVKHRGANAQTLRSNSSLRFSFSTNTYYTVKEERNILHKKGGKVNWKK